MLELKRLLKFTPTEAVFMMANSRLDTYLRPEIADVSDPESLGDTLTRVRIDTKVVRPEAIQNPYSGAVFVDYHRYDLDQIFGPVIVSIDAPTTVHEILNYIGHHTGIRFEDTDFVNQRVDTDEVLIPAASTSKRWVGHLRVALTAVGDLPHINQWLFVADHGGLVAVSKEYLWDKYPIDILDGLTVGKPSIDIYLRGKDHSGLIARDHITLTQWLPISNHPGLSAKPVY